MKDGEEEEKKEEREREIIDAFFPEGLAAGLGSVCFLCLCLFPFFPPLTFHPSLFCCLIWSSSLCPVFTLLPTLPFMLSYSKSLQLFLWFCLQRLHHCFFFFFFVVCSTFSAPQDLVLIDSEFFSLVLSSSLLLMIHQETKSTDRISKWNL